MKILLDECVDPNAARFFTGEFEVTHVRDLGWLGIKNGDLVTRANGRFDALFTIDGNMRYQTSLRGLSILVMVAEGHFRTVDDYREPIENLQRLRRHLSLQHIISSSRSRPRSATAKTLHQILELPKLANS